MLSGSPGTELQTRLGAVHQSSTFSGLENRNRSGHSCKHQPVSSQQKGTEGYWHFRNNELSTWGSQTWPELEFLDVKIQVQKPGQVCPPHLDFLGYYLENICKAKPELLELEHSTNKPAIDIWRMFIATEDYKLGQMFVINDEQWFWTKGDCIRLNNWKALHWTKNIGEKDRTIIKVTGVKV